MPIATLSNIEKTFGKRILFDKLNFSIDLGERVGLIGDNGSGKSSLFKVLIGQLLIDAGSVSIARSIKLGHLTQDPQFQSDNSVMDEAELAFAQLHKLSHRLRELEHEMAHLAGAELEKILRKYQHVQHQFDLAGGHVWRHRLEATLLGVGLQQPLWEQNVTTVSGGQQSRLALARLLISQPDLLLLDEPTNHLDLAAIIWLEKYLLDFSGAVVLISHDRYLLDRLATRIVWLRREQLASYPGNYSAFVQQRALQELSQQRAYEKQQASIEKQSEFIRRFGAGQRSKEAKGREKRLQRLLKSDAMIADVARQRKIRLSLDTDQRAGDRVLTVRDLAKSYSDTPLWQEINLDVRRGERIGIMGGNGSGKTTLLEALLGRREVDAGSIRWGANLSIGYYDQHLGDFDPDNTVAEQIRDQRTIADGALRQVMAMMLFRDEDLDKPIRLLSGGERARVALAQLLIDKPNVLLLDEPTNHLDISSCEALETSLKDFPGTILCVSHDRYFLDKIVGRLLILEGGSIDDFAGNYTAWQDARQAAARRLEEAQLAAKPKAAKSRTPRSAAPSKNNPWARRFGRLSVEQLEAEITQTEKAIADYHQRFADSASFKDAGAGKSLHLEYEELAKKLQDLEEEYFARQ